MSRLDSFIRRLEAQRACLEHVSEVLTDVEGCVFELGLGNGRTYDHLRALFPAREIFAFEIRLAAHPDCIPDDSHLFLGDFLDVLPTLASRFAALAPFLAPGAIVLSDSALSIPSTTTLAPPASVPRGRYFISRKA